MGIKHWKYCIITAAIILTVCNGERTYCAYKDSNSYIVERGPKPGSARTMSPEEVGASLYKVQKESEEYGEIFRENNTMKCLQNKHLCFSLWRPDPVDKNKREILKQGCWEEHVKQSCTEGGCATSPRYHPNNTRFCCCYGDFCNQNITDNYDPSMFLFPSTMATPEYHILPDPNYKERTIIIALVSVFLVALLIVITYLVYRLWLGSRKLRTDMSATVNLMEDGKSTEPPLFDLDQLKLCDQLHRGRYGEVWRATLNEQEVAVKLFSPHHRSYYVNERDVYALPHMEHDSLLKYYGAEEKIEQEGGFSYVIVLSYEPFGSLTHYLRHNTLDWASLCKMLHSIAKGLSHLHTEITIADKTKVAVAHRDLNSRNILVKQDLSCAICDFGFAMRICGSMFIRNGIEENAEQSSLTDVGTLRYMPPEVLEGAVNLRDCEASLKQIDIYAVGLVYWEIASRCTDLYQGMPVPDYKLPFEEEVGIHPSFEDMQNLVSRNKTRPKFPAVWKDTNHAVRALKETIEDSWDGDAEARLTSLCVEERVMDMISLWDVRNKGVTPTINSVVQLVNISSNDQSSLTTGGNIENDVRNYDEHAATIPRASRLSSTEHSVSASTTDTTLTASPTEFSTQSEFSSLSGRAPKNNVNLVYAKAHKILQPHQGQNPTVERNTHKRSDEELAIMGNSLVGKNCVGNKSVPMNFPDDLMEAIDNLESSLVQNDLLNQQQVSPPQAVAPPPTIRQPPISYLQNQVHSTEPMVVRPKQPNIPPNSNAVSVPPSPRSRSKLNSNKKPKDSKIGRLSLNIFGRNPFWKSSHTEQGGLDNKNYFPTENLRDPAPAPQLALLKQSHNRNVDENAIEHKSNLEPRPLSTQVPTEVCLLNGAPVVRPTSLPINQPAHPKLPPPPSYHREGDPGLPGASAVLTNTGSLNKDPSSSQKSSSTSSLSSTSSNLEENTGVGNAWNKEDTNHNVVLQHKPLNNNPCENDDVHTDSQMDRVNGDILQQVRHMNCKQNIPECDPLVAKSTITLRQFGDVNHDQQRLSADYQC